MDELVDRIVAHTGVAPAVARTAAIVILKFLLHEAGEEKVGPLVDALPGARAAIAVSSVGGTAGLMGAFNDLSALGLSLAEIQAVARSFGTFAREKAGTAAVDDIVASVPGLGAFV